MKQSCHCLTQIRSSLVYILVASALVVGTPVQAAVSLDRTRAVFNGANKSVSLNISNENKQIPYLAQAWLENASGKKITTGPLVVTPPVQRMEPGTKSVVRIMSTPGVASLPKDRESLFYFNLREIPPKSDKPNVLQIALQTRIKLFYRPEAIVQAPGAVWQDKLVLHRQAGDIVLKTPRRITLPLLVLEGRWRRLKKGSLTP